MSQPDGIRIQHFSVLNLFLHKRPLGQSESLVQVLASQSGVGAMLAPYYPTRIVLAKISSVVHAANDGTASRVIRAKVKVSGLGELTYPGLKFEETAKARNIISPAF
jgi:hypothetical protein